MIVPLPLGESDPVHRLQLIAAETAQRKHEARPRTGSGVFGSLLLLRAFLHGFAHQRLMNTSVTNVPGPPVPLYLPGHSCWSWSPGVADGQFHVGGRCAFLRRPAQPHRSRRRG